MKRLTSPLLLALVGTALAQSTSPLVLDYTQSLVRNVTANGKTTEQRTPNYTRVRLGDLLAQNLVARNVSNRTLKNLVLRLPVPNSMVYVAPDGTLPAGVRAEYSVDRGKTFSTAPLKTVTVTENGKSVTKQVEAKPNEYQAVRWVIGSLPAGTELRVGFRAQVK